MDYQQALEWVHGLGRMPGAPGLERMQRLMALLGNPQNSLKYIHVAGTNGKGSTVNMAAAVLKQAGYKVGANISPYVLEFRERFQVNGKMVSEGILAELLGEVRHAAEKLDSFIVEFEAVTAAAFLYFAKEKCDIVCLETGLGGRLDPTNIIKNTLVAGITHIGYDHTEFLGKTIEEITAEKCGIIKNGCTVISYPGQLPAARTEIAHAAKRFGCPLVVPEISDFHFYKGKPFENRLNYGGYDLQVPFAGVHQGFNAAVVVHAMLALCEKGFAIEDEDIMEGIRAAVFPARIEIVSSKPLVILDGAHNEDSVQALANTLRAEKVEGLTAVIGALQDKEADRMLRLLSPYIRRVYTVRVDSPRALSEIELADIAKNHIKDCIPAESVENAVEQALCNAESSGGGLLICGSLYLAAAARRILIK